MKLRRLSIMKVPDGFIHDDMIIYHSQKNELILSKGYELTPPYLSGMNVDFRNQYNERLRRVLHLLTKDGYRIQFQWGCGNNYDEILDNYVKTIENGTEYVELYKNSIFSYFKNQRLRKESLILFVSKPISNFKGSRKSNRAIKEYYEVQVDAQKARFENLYVAITSSLGIETIVKELKNERLFHFYRSFLSRFDQYHEKTSEYLDEELSILENCSPSNAYFHKNSTSFYLDGLYYKVLTISKWPKYTDPTIIFNLTTLDISDYRITLNLYPLDVYQEIKKEEKALKYVLQTSKDKGYKRSFETSVLKKEEKIDSLSSGYIIPFNTEFIIRVWADSTELVGKKATIIKQAIANMNGAQSFEGTLSATSKNIFYLSWPGYLTEKYKFRKIYSEDEYLVNMIPVSTSFVGKLKDPEAIYEGENANIVGVKLFEGNTPQHSVILGTSGSGKSVFVQDLLTQTHDDYIFTAIIDEGLSYGRYVSKVGCQTLNIKPDADYVINYFDTLKQPLTKEHLSLVITLVSKMIGEPESKELRMLRQAQLKDYIIRVYNNKYEDWCRKNPDKLDDIKRIAYGTHKLYLTRANEVTVYDIYYEFLEKLKKGDLNVLELYNAQDSEITKFSCSHEGSSLLESITYSYFEADDFPTHSHLVEEILYDSLHIHDKDEVNRMGTLLKAWCADGQYGSIFDGYSNVKLNSSVAYIELGNIPEQAEELKAACGLLITGFIRQHIMGLPRNQKKRIIFEEVARFLSVEGGDKIVSEAYAQLRKFSCCALSIVQQYTKFKESSVKTAIIGNSKQFFILKQMDKKDLEDLSQDIGLPSTYIPLIQKYPLPEQLPPSNRYASICYFSPATEPPFCGTIRNKIIINE